MISRIEAYNYRCFRRLAVTVGRYQVLAGANGAGKTTLLDIPMLFDDLLYGGSGNNIDFTLEMQLPAGVETGLAGLSTAGSRRPPPTHLRYEVRLELFNRAPGVAEEYLFLFPSEAPPAAGVPLQGRYAGGRQGAGAKWQPVIQRQAGRTSVLRAETTTRSPHLADLRIESSQLALASVPADASLFPAARWFIGLLRHKAVCFDPDRAALRRPAVPGDPPELLPDGRNTPWLALG